MLPGLDVVVMTGFLNAAAGGVACSVPKAPAITVTPYTEQIRYDFSRGTADLGAMKSDTVNPYGPGVDTATGGLRQDSADTQVGVRLGYQQYSTGPTCLWYDSINVTIHLAPKVYVAKEYGTGVCHEAILGHERHHVQVDREVINQYVQSMGAAIRDVVNRTGPIGPVDKADISKVQDDMSSRIKKAILAQKDMMEKDMRRRQAAVDSLQEYERVAKICRASGR